ncbi:hypothetical protein EYR05_10310 [Xanthomonas oryzae pv. oryzae]|uniref:hypothetical protein n=1 Tax=Xanthomonas oryzae TaxID=347 RepID=UPI0010359703|nr:hypothetical protein [Xanthomonas oryzae]QBI15995.1 hypothetical protein EYR03_10600 [Xanthomonas oryzae pv. oryzae]TAO91670.1 hypothetical protein EYR05_10310 [Xanthomonas oryzae pv. oryzae]
MTSNDSRMGTATLRHASSDRVKLTVTARYYHGKIDESGSFVYPGLAATDTLSPDYDVFPITMVTRTKEATLDANLCANVDMLGGHTRCWAASTTTGPASTAGWACPSATVLLARSISLLRATT